MRVNSSFKGIINKRLAVGSGIAIVLLAIFFIASSFTTRSNRDLLAKQVNLIIRQIGRSVAVAVGRLDLTCAACYGN